jgi:hypothetical protein
MKKKSTEMLPPDQDSLDMHAGPYTLLETG